MLRVVVIFLFIISFLAVPALGQPEETGSEHPHVTHFERVSADGSMSVIIDSSLPEAGSPLVVNFQFLDQEGNHVADVNYDIVVMQNGEIVLSQLGHYAPDGTAQHTTLSLSTDDKTDIMLLLQGIGKEAPYSGPRGETIEVTVVSEFGIAAFVMLSLAAMIGVIVQRAGFKKIEFGS